MEIWNWKFGTRNSEIEIWKLGRQSEWKRANYWVGSCLRDKGADTSSWRRSTCRCRRHRSGKDWGGSDPREDIQPRRRLRSGGWCCLRRRRRWVTRWGWPSCRWRPHSPYSRRRKEHPEPGSVGKTWRRPAPSCRSSSPSSWRIPPDWSGTTLPVLISIFHR